MPLRLLVDDGASASAGLALDETLASRVGEGISAPTLHLYTYRPHCVLVGRFQEVSHEIDLEACASANIDVNRRPTGGGAILMGPAQLGVALAVPRESGGARELMRSFAYKLRRALADLGINAVFRGKNDLAVNGAKIAGLGIHRDISGGLLFHASLLLDLDVQLMMRVLRTPFARVSRREMDIVSRRIATVRTLVDEEVTMNELREHVAHSFGVDRTGELDADERQAVATLEFSRYRDAAWVHQRSDVPDSAGRATVRTPGGIVDVRVAMAGRTIKTAWIRGDFFADDRTVAELEGLLRWLPAERDAIAAMVRRTWTLEGGTVDATAVIEAVCSAVARAINEPSSPYGCFVAPGSSHG
ncbi:MAG: hypothetical protein HRU14_00835 [Planctomycetes bacterium]|nr:hypothetical protein [Planctomycetota bacterium]